MILRCKPHRISEWVKAVRDMKLTVKTITMSEEMWASFFDGVWRDRRTGEPNGRVHAHELDGVPVKFQNDLSDVRIEAVDMSYEQAVELPRKKVVRKRKAKK